MPYLQQKKREAEIAVAFYSYKADGNKTAKENAYLLSNQKELCNTLRLVRKENIIENQKFKEAIGE